MPRRYIQKGTSKSTNKTLVLPSIASFFNTPLGVDGIEIALSGLLRHDRKLGFFHCFSLFSLHLFFLFILELQSFTHRRLFGFGFSTRELLKSCTSYCFFDRLVVCFLKR